MTGLRCFTLAPGCGYGDASAEVIAQFSEMGLKVRWNATRHSPYKRIPRKTLETCRPEIRQALRQARKRINRYDHVLLSLPPSGLYDVILDRETHKRPFAYCTWELEEIPPDWPQWLNRCDGVMVPSNFNKAALQAGGVKVPVAVAPHLPRQHHPEPVPDLDEICSNRLVFYSIATWSARKNVAALVRSYLDAFSASDPVILVIKTGNVCTEDWDRFKATCRKGERPPLSIASSFKLARVLADYPRPAAIHLVTEDWSGAQIDGLHARGDCFVSLGHSEGWGLCAYDALQAGNPVIMSDFGGPGDFLGNDYPLIIQSTMQRCYGEAYEAQFNGDITARWAVPDPAHASQLMQDYAGAPTTGNRVGKEWQNRIKKQFNASDISRDMARFMELAT